MVFSLLIAEARKQSRLKLPYFGLIAIGVNAAMLPHLLSYYSDVPRSEPKTGPEFVCSAMTSMGTMAIPLFVVIFTATLVAGETSHGTIRYVLCRPVTRVAFLLSKFATGFAYSLLILTVAVVAVTIVGGVAYGYSPRPGAMSLSNLDLMRFWSQFILACALYAIPLFATAAYGLCLSVICRSSGAAVGAAASTLVMMVTVFNAFEIGWFSLPEWLWSGYYDKALDKALNLAQGTPDLWISPEIVWSVIIPTAWILLFGAISLVVMLRRDWGN